MGWTYYEIPRHKSMDQVKADHVWEATRYGAGIKAEMIAHEWKAKTWFAIIRLTYPADHERYAGKVITWLRVDLIDTAGGKFGYKDMAEEMGPYTEDKPSMAFRSEIYRHIPEAIGYAKEWRERNGVKFNDAEQGLLV